MRDQQDLETLGVVPFDFTDRHGTVRLYVTLIDWSHHGMQNYSWVDAAWLHQRASNHPDFEQARKRYGQAVNVRQMRDEAGIAAASAVFVQFYAQWRSDTRHPFRDSNREPMPWPGTAPAKVKPTPQAPPVRPVQPLLWSEIRPDHPLPPAQPPLPVRQGPYITPSGWVFLNGYPSQDSVPQQTWLTDTTSKPSFGGWASALQDTIDAKNQYLYGRGHESGMPRYAGGYGNQYGDEQAKVWGPRNGVTGYVAVTQRGDYWQDSAECDVLAEAVMAHCGFDLRDEDDQALHHTGHAVLTTVFRTQQEWLPPAPPRKARKDHRRAKPTDGV